MNFFVLSASIGSDAETVYEPIGKPRLGEAPRCPTCGTFVGNKPWLPPYRVRLQTFGTLIGDIAFDLASKDLLLSERFVRTSEESGLCGLEADPVEVVEMPRGVAGSFTFFHAVAPRTGARIDRNRTRVSRTEPPTCDLCGGPGITNAIDGLWIDETSWNGADIFSPWGVNGVTVVTERVPLMAAHYHLKNVTITPSEAFRWDPLRGPRV